MTSRATGDDLIGDEQDAQPGGIIVPPRPSPQKPAAAKPAAFVELTVDVATMAPSPGWSMEIGGTVVHPSGHLYRVHVSATEPVSNAPDSDADVHVAIVDGVAYWFYRLGEC